MLKTLPMMKNIKIIVPVTLIITGIIIVGYPLYLRMQTKLEQAQLLKDFEIQSSTLFEYSTEDLKPQKPHVWKEWPDTKLEIPKINVKVMVVHVTDLDIFARKANFPPGHYPESAFPGEEGNVAIAAHRTGPADYFKHLDKLEKGDEIYLHTSLASYRYIVEEVFVTERDDWSVVDSTDYAALTLTTCEREGTVSSAKRLITRARLDEANFFF